jgi:uncharacterized damage-inducible protein DinB
MGVPTIQTLYAYHRWANRQLFDVAAKLGPDVDRDVGAQFSVPTLKGMFAHLCGADRVWLTRWKGASPARLPTGADFADLAAVRRDWDQLEAEQRQFVDALGPADLDRVIEYKNTQGKAFRVPLGPLLLHVANHATHHRSEIATMITMISGSPPDTGINTYIVTTTGQA